ncbi:hypothetical protein BGZ94_005224, partial [Podila epigama]
WDQKERCVVFADVQNVGYPVAISLPSSAFRTPLDWSAYPIVAGKQMNPLCTDTSANTQAVSQAALAKASLESARGTVENQLSLCRQRAGRLQATLNSKRQVIDFCQSGFTEDFRSTFWLPTPASTVVSAESHCLESRREIIRSRMLTHLLSIVGRPTSQSNPSSSTSSSPIIVLNSCGGCFEILSRIQLWVGIRIKNGGTDILSNVHLSIAGQSSKGQVISSLASSACCNVACVVDTGMLASKESLGKAAKILRESVGLHFERRHDHANLLAIDSMSRVGLCISNLEDADVPCPWKGLL